MESKETQILIKTRYSLVTQLCTRLTELHPYSVPEFLVLSATAGLESYVGWVNAETTEL